MKGSNGLNIHNEIICLHRIRVDEMVSNAHKVQINLGLSIKIDFLFEQLERTSKYIVNSNNKLLLTIDDGHKDVLLIKDIQKHYPFVQPIIFLTGKQLRGDTSPYPLTALYKWCFENNINLNLLKDRFGFDRTSLKELPEKKQRDLLKSKGIDSTPVEEYMVSIDDINELLSQGWDIGYHGPEHFNLTMYEANELKDSLKCDYDYINKFGYSTCFAWPEGRYNMAMFKIAMEVGFKFQFGLMTGGTASEIQRLPLRRVVWN